MSLGVLGVDVPFPAAGRECSPHAADGHGVFHLGSGIQFGKLKEPSVTLCLKEGVEGFSRVCARYSHCSAVPSLLSQALGFQRQTLPGTFSPYRPAWDDALTALLLKGQENLLLESKLCFELRLLMAQSFWQKPSFSLEPHPPS